MMYSIKFPDEIMNQIDLSSTLPKKKSLLNKFMDRMIDKDIELLKKSLNSSSSWELNGY